MCEALATTREHAPPLCLFPTQEVIGRDLRRNLITVPSCDTHNGKKSTDDEFLQAVVLMSAVANSDVAKPAFFGRFLRAVRGQPNKYKSFFDDKGSVEDNKLRGLRIDQSRFDKCISHLARALYFEATGSIWSQPLLVFSPNFYSHIESGKVIAHSPSLQSIDLIKQFLSQTSEQGQNAEVFEYRLRFEAGDQIFALAARFYEFFEVFAYSSQQFGKLKAEKSTTA